MAVKKQKKNTTWQKIKNSPFASATELKQHAEQVRMEEWDRVLRANERHNAMKAVDDGIGRLFTNGYKAQFKDKNDQTEHAVWVHLTANDEIKIEIDTEFKSKDTNGTLEALVRSLSQSFVSGYMMTVGLKNDDNLADGKNAKPSLKK